MNDLEITLDSTWVEAALEQIIEEAEDFFDSYEYNSALSKLAIGSDHGLAPFQRKVLLSYLLDQVVNVKAVLVYEGSAVEDLIWMNILLYHLYLTLMQS